MSLIQCTMMALTAMAILRESVNHVYDTGKVIRKQYIHLVALTSFLVNLVNLLIVHEAKDKHESLRHIGMSDHWHSHDGEDNHSEVTSHPSDPDTSHVTDQAVHHSESKTPIPSVDLVVPMDPAEEGAYYHQASKSAVSITLLHLFFDLMLRSAVLFSALMIRYLDMDEFDYYCSFAIAIVMTMTVTSVLTRTVINMRGHNFNFTELSAHISDNDSKFLQKNCLIIHEGKKNLLLIFASNELKLKVDGEGAHRFCQTNGLAKIIWESEK